MPWIANLLRSAGIVALVLSSAAPIAPVAAQGLGSSIEADRENRPLFPRRLCLLTDRSVREAIRDQGYTNIYLNVPVGRFIQARATRGDWVYLLRVDYCSGTVVDRKRLRPAKG